MFRFILLLSCLFSFNAVLLGADDSGIGPNLLNSTFESGQPTYNPWGGVDDQGNIHVGSALQLAASDAGDVAKVNFSPSVAVGDLNGDGLPDLVVADARGFFWYFPNSGKPTAPAFTHGEIMPIWLYEDSKRLDGAVVPRIQLVDFTGDKKLSIVASNFTGQLFYLPNHGSVTVPAFSPTNDLDALEIPTHSGKLLWCNYLAPFLYDWSGTGRLDLLVGDGSYSANSIYLFTNKGSNDRPVFQEENRVKLIPGMGKEHLTPQVVDWNNDGKPDIIAGERTGYVNIYLNQATKANSTPVFTDVDKVPHVMFGTSDKTGGFTTVCAADLNGDKLFDLIIGNPDGSIFYALNIGTPGAPKFGPLVNLKGVYPYSMTSDPLLWKIDRLRPYGSPYEMLETVNATTDSAFVPQPDSPNKGAMKFSVLKTQNVFFPNAFVPTAMERSLLYDNSITLQTETRYHFEFWMRTDGDVSDIQWSMDGLQPGAKGEAIYTIYSGDPMAGSSSWTKMTQDIRIPRHSQDETNKKPDVGTFKFYMRFKGTGTLYFNNFSLKKAK